MNDRVRQKGEIPLPRSLRLYETIAPVLTHLEELGASIGMFISTPTRSSLVERFEAEFNLSLPDAVREFYIKHADGLFLHWTIDALDVQGNLTIASLNELRLARQRWLNSDQGPKPIAKRVEPLDTALKTWERMANWLPIWEEGNGDLGCIDAATGQIVWHCHDWADGGDGTNGYVIESDILNLIRNWASVCFSTPKSLSWWHVTSATQDAADWNSDEFDARCRL